MEPRIQYAKTSDGVNIACWARGEGPSVVTPGQLFGGIELSLLNPPTLEVNDVIVQGRRRVIRYDGRSTGWSGRQSRDFSIEARVADLEAVIDHFDLDNVSLLGTMHGGATSIVYAVRHPERVSQLILSGAYASGKKFYNSMPSLRAVRAMRTVADEEWEFYVNTLAHNTAPGFAGPEEEDEIARAMLRILTKEDFVLFNDATDQIDVTSLLPQVEGGQQNQSPA